MDAMARAATELAHEEARIREDYERDVVRLRREAGHRLAMVLGIDPEKWWEPCAVMVLSPKPEWRLQACRALLFVLRSQAYRERREQLC